MPNLNPDFYTSSEKHASRDGFGLGLKEAAEKNNHIVGLCADLTESTRMNIFKDAFPDRFVEVGVAEQNLMSVAAGFALAGKIPFAASYAAFNPYNSYGGIRTAICYSNLNVKIMGGHAGLGIGEDGAVTQALEDIALMRVLPNMTVVVPCDKEEARKATLALASHVGPAYIRTTKFETRPVTTPETSFKIGEAITLTEGTDATIIVCGPMVEQALLAAQLLKENGKQITVLNMHTIKPLDTLAIQQSIQRSKVLVTVEDHQIYGGLGSAVAEYISQLAVAVKFKMIGVKDSFGQSGKGDELYKKYGLTAKHIVETVETLLR